MNVKEVELECEFIYLLIYLILNSDWTVLRVEKIGKRIVDKFLDK